MNFDQQPEHHAEELLRYLSDSHTPQEIQHLRHLLSKLEEVFIQEKVLDIVRLQKFESTDEWVAGAGGYNSRLNYQLWRGVRGRGYELMEEFKKAAAQAFGSPAEALEQHSVTRLRTDYDPVRQVYLVYPENVVGEGYDYSRLGGFYNQLLQKIPQTVEVVLFVKSRALAKRLEAQGLRERLRCVVHSELKSIWLRDTAGFNMGTQLVKPKISPRAIGDSMKMLHSLLDVDLKPLPLEWDGGNLVANNSYGFISDRLLWLNGVKSEQGQERKREIERLIITELGIAPVWVKLPKTDKLAHTDGYLTFISENRALVSTYPADWAKRYPAEQSCVDELARQVREMGIEVERVLDTPTTVPGPSSIDSAVGIYVNFLQLNGTWLVPAYGLAGETELMAQLRRLNPEGSVEEIDCRELAGLGGVLHCISFCN